MSLICLLRGSSTPGGAAVAKPCSMQPITKNPRLVGHTGWASHHHHHHHTHMICLAPLRPTSRGRATVPCRRRRPLRPSTGAGRRPRFRSGPPGAPACGSSRGVQGAKEGGEEKVLARGKHVLFLSNYLSWVNLSHLSHLSYATRNL